MKDVSLGYDLYTQYLFDRISEENHFWETHDTCTYCKKIFSYDWEEVSESLLEKGKVFCCHTCRDKWDLENVDDYVENGLDSETAFNILMKGEQLCHK
jgi:hypothetical protein